MLKRTALLIFAILVIIFATISCQTNENSNTSYDTEVATQQAINQMVDEIEATGYTIITNWNDPPAEKEWFTPGPVTATLHSLVLNGKNLFRPGRFAFTTHENTLVHIKINQEPEFLANQVIIIYSGDNEPSYIGWTLSESPEWETVTLTETTTLTLTP